jgi:hypothetical protein
MTDRDHFAAAAFTGLLAQGDDGSFSEESYARAAFRWADVMLRERERNGAVAGRETVPKEKLAEVSSTLHSDAAGYTGGVSPDTKSKTDAEREAIDPVDFGGLTDEERKALAYYIGTGGPDTVDAALRTLLERTK